MAVPISAGHLRSRHAHAARAAAPASPLVLTDEEAKKLEQQVAERSEKARRADRRATAPRRRRAATARRAPYGNVGGYNNFWLDPGSRYTTVDGRKRASLLIDPPDGRVPRADRSGAAAQRARARCATDVRPGEQAKTIPASKAPTPTTIPNCACLPTLPARFRLFGGGPPMLPSFFYNNLKQVVQTQGHRG